MRCKSHGELLVHVKLTEERKELVYFQYRRINNVIRHGLNGSGDSSSHVYTEILLFFFVFFSF